MITWIIITAILILLEITYLKIAKKHHIIASPNERSSHASNVLSGGGIIFVFSIIIWLVLQVLNDNWGTIIDYIPFICGLLMVATISFIDDIKPLPGLIRLVIQFIATGLMLYNLGITDMYIAWIVILILIVYVGAINIVNFMDGINGITVTNSIAVLIPLYIVNNRLQEPFISNSFIFITLLGVLVFGIFNFRPKGKAKCFTGDVGSISIAYILLFILGELIAKTNDFTWLIFLLVYGVDGCLTICHRIILHENLVKAHRKHIYQLMANELKIGHIKISILYMVLQLIISMGFIFLCPDSESYHWLYLTLSVIIVSVAYLFFKCKYFYLYKDSNYKTKYS